MSAATVKVVFGINCVICALAYAGLTIWSGAFAELTAAFRGNTTMASWGLSLFMMGYAIGSVTAV